MGGMRDARRGVGARGGGGGEAAGGGSVPPSTPAHPPTCRPPAPTPHPPPAGSLDAMFALYKQLLPEMGGYLTHAGELSRRRLEVFMSRLAEAEADVLHARAEVGARTRRHQGL